MRESVESVLADISAVRMGVSQLPDVNKLLSLNKIVPLDTAKSILYSILRWDLAYGREVISESDAVALTARFFNCFDLDEIKFFTNANFDIVDSVDAQSMQKTPIRVALRGWDEMTTATFDTGIYAVTPKLSGYCWICDED